MIYYTPDVFRVLCSVRCFNYIDSLLNIKNLDFLISFFFFFSSVWWLSELILNLQQFNPVKKVIPPVVSSELQAKISMCASWSGVISGARSSLSRYILKLCLDIQDILESCFSFSLDIWKEEESGNEFVTSPSLSAWKWQWTSALFEW